MITRYTSAPDKYDQLFIEANTRLKEVGLNGDEIQDLESYFMHLRDLVYGPNDSLTDPIEIEKGYPFLKLPLDEPHLKIDANSRTINTKDFSGILSVQGDEIAEIVFFEVDRYFDATDLAQMQIAIQWKNKEDEGSTPAFIRIIEYSGDDEKLIFGWPITSEITRVPGAVQFSVRFYDRNDDTEEMNYSLVTLPATMNIGASLTTDLDEDSMDDPRPVILNRLRNSTTLSQLDQAKAPIFVYRSQTPVEGNVGEVDFKDATTFDLKAMSRKNGSGGTISYKWYKAELTSEGTPAADYIPLGNPVDYWESAGVDDKNYVEVFEYISNVSTYYYKKQLDNNETEWTSLSLDEANFNAELQRRKHLYIRTSVLTLEIKPNENVLGYYYVDSRVGSVGTYAYASGTIDEDQMGSNPIPTWVVRGPEIVDLNDLAEYGNIGDTIELSGTNLNNTTSYEWFYCANEDFANEVEIVGTAQSYELDREGYYKATATNYKNGASNNDTTNYLISLGPIEDWGIEITSSEGNTYTVSMNRAIGFKEEVVYQWYNVNGGELLSEGDIYTVTDESINAIQVNAILTKGNLPLSEKQDIFLVGQV